MRTRQIKPIPLEERLRSIERKWYENKLFGLFLTDMFSEGFDAILGDKAMDAYTDNLYRYSNNGQMSLRVGEAAAHAMHLEPNERDKILYYTLIWPFSQMEKMERNEVQ